MRTPEWVKKHYRLIFDFIWLAIIIAVIFKFYVGRQWCYNLVQPYLDYWQVMLGTYNPKINNSINSTNFDEFMRTFNQNSNKSSCKCP